MCGILIALRPAGLDALSPVLHSALGALAHRGPDNLDHWANDTAFLGHTRLSIVGTGSNANQPYQYENLVLAYNGEVFNYVEMRRELADLGYQFTTDSDTEVVIKAYHHYGSDCFDKFNGMWALAIYDRHTQELVLSRDRFGQKPLFVANAGDAFFAASELQSLAYLVDVEPNFAAIQAFLKEGDFDAAGNTFFEGVFEFPKACYARLREGRVVEVRRYWDYPQARQPARADAEDFYRLLDDAVALRLRTDVDYCLLLSGGCDSTIVAGITRALVGPQARLSAFTFSSGDKDDESRYAAQVAEGLEIELHLSAQHSQAEDYITRLRRLVRHLGRGHSSPAVVSVDQLYESIRARGYKVALDGPGADELLAGYKHYHLHLLLDLIRLRAWRQILPLLADLKLEGIKGVLLMALRNSLPVRARRWLRAVYGYERLFAQGARGALRPHPMQPAEAPFCGLGLLEGYLQKQHTIGLTNLLYYGDIVAMANSVENRSPFMDHRLVEMSFSGDFRLKVDMGRDKAVLRAHPVHRRFAQVLERKKVGFTSPVTPGVKQRMVDELQTSVVLNWPIFDKAHMLAFLCGGDAMRGKYERFLFRLFQVHLWQQEYLASSVRAPHAAPSRPALAERRAAA